MREPFLIAELSANHLGSLDRALAIVDAAADAGADAVKIQTWSQMCVPGYVIKDGPWAGRELSDLYREAETPWDWHGKIFDRCKERGIIGFSTPFDHEALLFLEQFDLPMYKVASFEITDLPLIEAIARRGRPMLISTGMATWEEIEAAYDTALNYTKVTLLRCSSAYPAPPSSLNLSSLITWWCEGYPFGFSDHTLGHTAAVMAVALGATVIEKHLTLLRSDGGPDAAFSAEPHELAELVKACRDAHQALGDRHFGPTDAELPQLQFRRGLWAVQAIPEGGEITAQNVKSLRPAGFIEPFKLPDILGRKVNRMITAGTPITWEMLA